MLKKSLGQKLKEIFRIKTIDKTFFDDLEDLLVESDMGVSVSVDIVKSLRQESEAKKIFEKESLYNLLADIVSEKVSEYDLLIDKDRLNIILFLGVNGVGKTTTIAKSVKYIQSQYGNPGIVLSAGDTFRAAAIDQLKIHGERLGVRVVSQEHGADPGAVIFDTIESAKARGEKVILADTAGRMHNKANLVKELQKIDKIIRSKAAGENYMKFLVIDSTTGQNGLSQAEVFNEAVGVDAAVLAKYDSAARGGIAVSISGKLGIPFVFVGTGEKYTDIKKFDRKEYLENLLSG